MAFVAVHDACMRYPSTLRDLLFRVAQAGMVRAKRTDRILDEVFDNLKAGSTRRPTARTGPGPVGRGRPACSRNVQAVHPDEFVLARIDLNRQQVCAAVQQIADAWRNPPGTVEDVLVRYGE